MRNFPLVHPPRAQDRFPFHHFQHDCFLDMEPVFGLLEDAGMGRGGLRSSRSPHPCAPAASLSPARAAVPVRTATVEKADFPVYLTGLGTVQGFNTVLVRTRVDGQINKIDFKSIKICYSGAAPLLADTKQRFEALTGARIAGSRGWVPSLRSRISARFSITEGRPTRIGVAKAMA